MASLTEGSPELKSWSMRLIAAVLLGGILVAFSYRARNNRLEANSARPAFSGKIERDFGATNHDGSPFSLSTLKGDVFLGTYLSTTCTAGCVEVARRLELIRQEFAATGRVHIVAFSVDSSTDTPERIHQFMEENALNREKWIYLTDPSGQLITELNRYRGFKFLRPKEVTDPEIRLQIGPWEHDVRVALVDPKANIRGYYRFLDPEQGDAYFERLRQDIRYLIDQELPSVEKEPPAPDAE